MSGSSSRRHSGPKPNLYEDTDHFARWPMSGQGSSGGFRPGTGGRSWCIWCWFIWKRRWLTGVHEQRAVHGQLRHDEAVQRGQAERAYAGHLSGTGWWCMQWYLLYARSEPVCKASTEAVAHFDRHEQVRVRQLKEPARVEGIVCSALRRLKCACGSRSEHGKNSGRCEILLCLLQRRPVGGER